MKSLKKIIKRVNFKNNTAKSGGFLIGASILANVFNLIFAIYTGRVLSLENFAVIGFLASIEGLTEIPFSSFSRTVSHKTAYAFGSKKKASFNSWRSMMRVVIRPSIITAAVWLLAVPFLSINFQHISVTAFLSFTSYWALGLFMAVNSGFISGSHSFKLLAGMLLGEVFAKLAFTFLIVLMGFPEYAYLAFPLSIIVRFGLEIFFIKKIFGSQKNKERNSFRFNFPIHFFLTSVLNRITAVVFLSGDVILANRFLSPQDAGRYTILSTAGKLIYFLGSLSNQFMNPIISKSEGAKSNSKKLYLSLMGITLLFSGTGYIIFGLLGKISVPLILGSKADSIAVFLPMYGLGMLCISIGNGVVSYSQIKKRYASVIFSFLVSCLALGVLFIYNDSIAQFNSVITLGGIAFLLAALFFSKFGSFLGVVVKNNFPIHFSSLNIQRNGTRSILVFNWRDTRHTWAGGAEVYLHEILKRFVRDGNHVTLFCGNDGSKKNYEIIDGVHIVRRGGFYTIYFWAFVYYLAKFRGKYDVVVDCENGIPFFTPLFSRKPIVLLIYHIHQEVFRDHLKFPFSLVAMFLEAKLMPVLYKSKKILTISNSSKSQIQKIGFQEDQIDIALPGVDLSTYEINKKTLNPTFTYLGRLKPYKNVDIAIRAFARVVKKMPAAELFIAGEGESDHELMNLTKELKLTEKVTFLGRVTEEQKIKLLGKCWVAIQPSQVEGWGMTVIEANACGTPVVASRVNGLVDSIVEGKTGILAEPRDVAAFSRALLKISSNEKLRSAMSKNALLWSRKFSWDTNADKFMGILDDAISLENSKNSYSRISAKLGEGA